MQQIPSSLEFSNISNINNNETSSINEDEDKKIQSICNEIEDKAKENQIISNEIHDNANATQNLCCCSNNTANGETIFISPWQPKFKIENVRIFRGNKYSEVKFNFEYVDDGKNMSIDINMFFEKNSDVLCFINGDKMIAGKEETNNIIKDIGRKMNDLLDIIDQYKNNSEITSLAVQCLFIVLFNNRDLYCLNNQYNHQCDVIHGALLQNYEQKLEEFEKNMRKKIDEEEEKNKMKYKNIMMIAVVGDIVKTISRKMK